MKKSVKKEVKKTSTKKQKIDLTGKAKSCKFVAFFKKSPVDPEDTKISCTFDKPETDLTYDEVENKLYLEMIEICPEDCYPKAFIKSIFIEDHKVKNKLYPVYPEDSKEISDKKLQKEYEAILVLPWATYKITDEAKLYYNFIEEGLLSEDEEFDFEKMHRILEQIKK